MSFENSVCGALSLGCYVLGSSRWWMLSGDGFLCWQLFPHADDHDFQKKPRLCIISNLDFAVPYVSIFRVFLPLFSHSLLSVYLHLSTDKTLTYVSVTSAPFSLGIFRQQLISLFKFFLLCCLLHFGLQMSLAFPSHLKVGLLKNAFLFFVFPYKTIYSLKQLRPNWSPFDLPAFFCISLAFGSSLPIVTVTKPKQVLTSSHWEYKE